MPPQVLAMIDSSVRAARLRGVDEAELLANSTDLAMAAAAWRVLRSLTDEDSRSVAAAATAALERSAVRFNPDRVDFGTVVRGTPELAAEVLIEGAPLAIATSTVTVAGPGLRARMDGRRLHIVWEPESDWLDGSVTVRGPTGWAEVRVTGLATAPPPSSRAEIEARLPSADGANDFAMSRMTVLSAPPPRRRSGATVLLAALTAGVVLGGGGVAVAMNRNEQAARQQVAALDGTSAPSTTGATPRTLAGPSVAAPKGTTVPRIPLARSVVSVAKPAVTGTIRVGKEPEGVAVSPNGRTIYVANQGERVLSVVDAVSRRVTSIKLRNTPRFVTTSRDGRLVFVSMYENDKKTGSGVAVVDAAQRKVVRYLITGDQPFTLAVGPDDRLWVPIHSSGRIEVFAAKDQHPDGRIAVKPNPHAVAFSANLMRAVTPNHESNAVSIIDMGSGKVLRSIGVSKAPHSVAVSPNGRTVLVAGYEADAANLIDLVTMRRSGPFKVGSKPQSVAFATDGAHAYVVNEGGGSVSVLNGRTGAVTATVRVGGSPRSVAVSPDGTLAYVSNGDDNTISVLRIGK
ncbi:hypothetical protein AFR_06685 [Actinoplanes friuliensis DSM 7358]|uniref:Uncharacterized protein n=1 Tax=Actinoplanes friuliensis DSM 7358 TaxID=1246995 RepID=U5VVH7_9ACTN|nr:hypothetical protein AFR_06685 [Actinoplanes friuliensis DSM 7358]